MFRIPAYIPGYYYNMNIRTYLQKLLQLIDSFHVTEISPCGTNDRFT